MPTPLASPRLRHLWHHLRAPSEAVLAAVAQVAATVAVVMAVPEMAADAPVASVRAADPVALVRAHAALVLAVLVTLAPATLVLVTLVQGRSAPAKDALQLPAECGTQLMRENLFARSVRESE